MPVACPEHQLSLSSTQRPERSLLLAPPGSGVLPLFDRGWIADDGSRRPYLAYVTAEQPVNWSSDLESLHEESSRTHFLDRWTRSAILSRIGPIGQQAAIADVGCSTGYLLHDLRQAHPQATLIGVDMVSAGLEKAHGLVASALLLRADCRQLPIVASTLDAIVSANLLEHVPDDQRALAEFARVLRPGGRAVIVVPAGPSTYDYYDRFLGHERRYGRRELARKCAGAGLEVIEDGYIASLLFPAFWLVKQRNRRLHRDLYGEALEAKVASDISMTQRSLLGEATWSLERRLAALGVRLPFGIRSLVVARRPGGRS